MRIREKTQWWKKYFDQRYPLTYLDLAPQVLTERQVDFLESVLKLTKKSIILDLCCGYGRHSLELTKRKYKVVGLDFSEVLLKIARETARKKRLKTVFVQEDMRQLNLKTRFTDVISLFTSFGYFEDYRDNLIVLNNVRKALKSDGKFLIDLNNPSYVLNAMIKKGKLDQKNGLYTLWQKRRLSNGLDMKIKQELDLAMMRLRVVRFWREAGKKPQSYSAQFSLFTYPEIKMLLEQAGLKVLKTWGDFDYSPFTISSKRMITLAQKIR